LFSRQLKAAQLFKVNEFLVLKRNLKLLRVKPLLTLNLGEGKGIVVELLKQYR
jgi:hypothetical protein